MRKIILITLMWVPLTTAFAQAQEDNDMMQHSATSDVVVQQKLEALGVPFTDGNSVRLLDSGHKKFNSMLAAINSAKRYVHLEYFNFRNDSLGRVLFTLLGEKVQQGVKVRAMFDSFGNSSNDSPLKKEHLKLIRDAGVEVYEFDPIKFPWINHAYHRDHRKIVVIDGEVAYSGGMNVADYYIYGRPEFGAWRDMHMELHGPVVMLYEKVFEQMWYKVSGEVISPEECEPVNDSVACALDAAACDSLITVEALGGAEAETHDVQAQLAQPMTEMDSVVTGVRIGLVDRSPRVQPKIMRKAFVAAIDAAQEHIQIINPYPTNVKSVRHAIWRALKRGVKVEIMVSAKCDVPITPDVVGLEMKHMAKRGAQVWYNNDGFHHSKVMMVDGRFCTVGSTNLDARSFMFDYEVNSFIINPHTTAELNGHFEREKAKCDPYSKEDWRRRFNFGHRLLGRMFSLVKCFF